MSGAPSSTHPSTAGQHHKPVSVTSQCLAIVLKPSSSDNSGRSNPGNGVKLFADFLEENRQSFWNPGLVESVSALEFVGFMKPGTLLVSGTEIHLECLRGAWARRVLKPPRGYSIKSLGDIGGIEMQSVPQTQFISLPETLCLLISSMNRGGQPATLSSVTHALRNQYAGMTIPNTDLLYGTIAALMSEGKVYCMGEHYFVSTPLMYQHYQAVNYSQQRMAPGLRNVANPYHTGWDPTRQSNPKVDQRQDLCSRECQTGASIVNAVPAYKPSSNKRDQATSAQQGDEVPEKGKTTGETKAPSSAVPTEHKGEEKTGFFKRFFRRSKSRELKAKGKQATDAKQSEKEKPKNESRSSSASGSNQPLKHHLLCGETVSPPTPTVEEVPPLSTFSAQFPPTEWLPHAKYQQAPTGSGYQGFFSKQRRSRGDKQAGKDRNTIWVDLDGTFKRDTRRHSRNDPLFMSQRYGTVPENLSKNAQFSPKPERRSKNKHRLSKYLSSSSECLYCPLPPIPQEVIPRRSKGERRHHRSHKGGGGSSRGTDRDQTGGWANQEVLEGPNLGKFAVSEPYKEPVASGSRHSQQTPRSARTDPSSHERNTINPTKSSPRAGQSEPGPLFLSQDSAPLAQPTDVDLSTTATTSEELAGRETEQTRGVAGVFEGMGREVGPLPSSSSARTQARMTGEEGRPHLRANADKGVMERCGDKEEGVEEEGNGRRASDSALSASPVVTEMSSASSGGSSNKYSSWSGSEGRHADALREAEEEERAKDETTERQLQRRDPMDHTYINLRNFQNERDADEAESGLKSEKLEYPHRLPSPINPLDPTYENIAAHLESTQFENMTLEEEEVMLDGNSNPIRVSSAKLNLRKGEETPVPESKTDKHAAHYISAV